MSNPSDPIPATKSLPYLDPAAGLLCVAADSLIPLFKKGSIDTSHARNMAMSAIEAYEPRSRADFVNIARIIAFSMAALALLASAAPDEMTIAQKMRAFGRANTLHRSAEQSERSMMQRRRYLAGMAPPALPDEPAAAPSDDAIDADIQAAVAEALHEYRAARQKAEDPPDALVPAAAPQPLQQSAIAPAAIKPPTADSPAAKSAATPSVRAMPSGTTPSGVNHPGTHQPSAALAALVHNSAPKSNTTPQALGSFRSALLHQTALQTVISQDCITHSAAGKISPHSPTRSPATA